MIPKKSTIIKKKNQRYRRSIFQNSYKISFKEKLQLLNYIQSPPKWGMEYIGSICLLEKTRLFIVEFWTIDKRPEPVT